MSDQAARRWECDVCGYSYDEVKEGLPWDELPDDWECPVCGAGKGEFKAAGAGATMAPAEAAPSSKVDAGGEYLAQWSRASDEREGHMTDIHRMAITDELTGLTNRRHMMHMLRRQKAVADRGGNGFCVCFFDLDRFKSINDRMGHHVGDVVLKRFSSEVQRQLRDSDMFARFGGEEFVLLANGVDLERAAIAADRIRKAIEALRFIDVASDLTVTVSGGVAQFRSKEKIEALLSRADQALYAAKGRGGSCIRAETDR